jgi:fatty-acyl-CoA synthase
MMSQVMSTNTLLPSLLERESQSNCDDAVNIQFTSGTTGYPKGVTLSHHNVLNNGYYIGEALHVTKEDSICNPTPLFHCFGMVIGNLVALNHGAQIVYPSPSFDARAAL